MITADSTTRHTLTNLRIIVTHWPDLHHALATTGTATWPPAGRMNDYLASIDRRTDDEREAATWQARALRDLERSPDQIGETRAPIRLQLLDTVTAVEADLLELADQIAATVQRSPMSYAPRGWPAADRARRDQLAREDAADPRRWRYVGTRTARHAAAWLLARVQGLPGPFERLTDEQLLRIATVAGRAARRVETALDMTDHKAALTHPCPDCSGELVIEAGGGARPMVWCGCCGRTWHEPEPTAA
ncbi:hypothetical protein [Streptomyces sp. DASNCL29]|uniref:hypothetical protein n=1 Tax=Streptomyces sp. DASNCL29 TaxID=2583819 RepID=UPI00110F87DD|nr:hypothetical protein [Streptomyces sp. DASNCL29]TMU98076.1 hypothetical protein FGK60_09605 [Streptomyces sp. DASNCL29]